LINLSPRAFEELVEQALAEVPAPFRGLVRNVEIAVQDRPGPEAAGLEDPDLLLGLYVGPTRAEMASPLEGPDLPPRILLYRRNLLEAACDHDDLRREIKLTLRHELAHYFGFTDEELHKKWPEGA
jgi:predicted Zn-dependent protease with MMP-like domain